jgi:DNA-binding transcriptional ArsR family regulator
LCQNGFNEEGYSADAVSEGPQRRFEVLPTDTIPKGEVLRYVIFQMLADGNSPCVVARRLKLRQSHVHYHQRLLEDAKAIARIGPGTPITFKRGKQAARYEDHFKRLAAGQITDDETMNFKSYLVSRTHTPGRITYAVRKLGDVHSYVNKKGTERVVEELFPKDGARSYNGSTYYDTKVRHDGFEVSIQLQITDRLTLLHIWPHEVLQTRAEILSGDPPFKQQCREIVRPLQKYAGWEVECDNFEPTLHYALVIDVDEQAASNDFIAPNAWADRSTGKLEIETDSKDTVLEWLSYPRSV